MNDRKLVALNAVGLSLRRIAAELNCHHSSVAKRLNELGQTPFDNRSAFVEPIWDQLTPDQREWLAGQSMNAGSIQNLVRQMLLQKYLERNPE